MSCLYKEVEGREFLQCTIHDPHDQITSWNTINTSTSTGVQKGHRRVKDDKSHGRRPPICDVGGRESIMRLRTHNTPSELKGLPTFEFVRCQVLNNCVEKNRRREVIPLKGKGTSGRP